MINFSDVETIISECFGLLEKSAREKMDSNAADKAAALFLVAQMKLSFLIEEVELNARSSKNEIERIEGEKYFDFKIEKTAEVGKKTENMLAAMIDKDKDVAEAKLNAAKKEAELKKYVYLLGTLKDGHLYFRNQNKSKMWSE